MIITSIVQHIIQIKNGIMKHVNDSKIYCQCKKDYIWNPSTCICENDKYFKSIGVQWNYKCYSVSTNVTNNILINITRTVSINFDHKKIGYKMDYYKI